MAPVRLVEEGSREEEVRSDGCATSWGEARDRDWRAELDKYVRTPQQPQEGLTTEGKKQPTQNLHSYPLTSCSLHLSHHPPVLRRALQTITALRSAHLRSCPRISAYNHIQLSRSSFIDAARAAVEENIRGACLKS